MRTKFKIAHNRRVARRLNSPAFQAMKVEIRDKVFEEEMKKRFQVTDDAKRASSLIDIALNLKSAETRTNR